MHTRTEGRSIGVVIVGEPLTEWVGCCERCEQGMWRRVGDTRKLHDKLCPECGSKNEGILTRVPFRSWTPFKNSRPGPVGRPPRSTAEPPRFVDNVYVCKCACGNPVYKPAGRRGRNPTRCEMCRQKGELRS